MSKDSRNGSRDSVASSSRGSNSSQRPGSRAESKTSNGSNRGRPVVASSSPLAFLGEIPGLGGMFGGGNTGGSKQSSRQGSRSAESQQSNSNPVGEFLAEKFAKPAEQFVQETQNKVKEVISHFEGLTSNNTPPAARSEPRPLRRPRPDDPNATPSYATPSYPLTNSQNKSPLKQSPEIYASDIEAIRQAVNSSRQQNTSVLKSYLNELEGSVKEKSGMADFRKSSPSTNFSNPAKAISLTDDAKQKLNLIISGIESWRDWEGKKAVVQAINRGRENFSGRSGRSGRSSISSISELGQKVVISTSQPPANRYATSNVAPKATGDNPTTSQSQSPKFYKSDLDAVKKFLNSGMLRDNLGLDKLRTKLELIEERTENLQPGEAINIANSKKGVFNMMIDEIRSMNEVHRKNLVVLINKGRNENKLPRITKISALRQPDGNMPTTPSANPTNARAANIGQTRQPAKVGALGIRT